MVFCGSVKLVVVASRFVQLASSHAVNPAPFAKWSLMTISPPFVAVRSSTCLTLLMSSSSGSTSSFSAATNLMMNAAE